MKEIWKDIPGYEGIYQISNCGRIKALEKDYVICNTSLVHTKERILASVNMPDGYKRIELNHEGVSRTFPVHRLVALAFLPNPDNKPHIDHINAERDDNRVDNLRWVTPKENAANPITKARKAIAVQNRPSGTVHPLFEDKSPDAKPVLQYDKEGNFIARYTCCHQAGRLNKGFSYSCIARACRGERKTYKKYIWRYEDIN